MMALQTFPPQFRRPEADLCCSQLVQDLVSSAEATILNTSDPICTCGEYTAYGLWTNIKIYELLVITVNEIPISCGNF